MRIGDKTPPPDAGADDEHVEIAPPGGKFRRVADVAEYPDDMVTLGEDLYGILCELLDNVPPETQMGIAMAFQSRPHPAFGELGEDVRAAFEAGAAAFDDDEEALDDEDDDGDEDDDTDE